MAISGTFGFLAAFAALISSGQSAICYPGCECTTLSDFNAGIINCTGASLRGIPQGILLDTYALIINDDKISAITENTFNTPAAGKMRVLALQRNGITELEAYAFVGLVHLDALYLSQNSVARLEQSVFRGLHLVRTIGLTDNNIEYIDSEAFNGLESLTNLHLAGNHIRSFSPDLFRHNPKLTELSLSDNFQLRIPTDKPFLVSASLKVLNMSYCAIDDLPTITFQDTPNLQKLDLANNDFVNGPHPFYNLSKLEVLNLEESSIETLEPNVFQSLENLRQLHLNGNKLRSLHPSTFQQNSKLKVLTLINNELNTLDVALFHPLINLKELDLRSNSLPCDCRLQAIYIWCTQQNVTTNAECKSSDGSQRLPWTSVSQLNCVGESSVLDNSGLGSRKPVNASDLQKDTLRVSSWNMYILIVVCTLIFILLGMFFTYVRRRYKESLTPTAYDVSAASEAGGTYNSFPMGEVTSVIMNSALSDRASITPQSTLGSRYSRSPAYVSGKITL